MQTSVTVSAPGKLLLLGDHAVVHTRPCLVTSVSQRMKVKVSLLDSPHFELQAVDVGINGYKKPMTDLGKNKIPKGAKFVEIAVRNFNSHYLLKRGVLVETSSEFSSNFGFGSSSASTVCIIKALSELLEIHLTKKELFDLAYKTVLDIQGVGSGFDIASAIYGGTLYFVGGGSVIEPIRVSNVPLVVGYSGQKGDTAVLVKMVVAQMKENPALYETLFDASTQYVEEGKRALVSGDFESFGRMMNKNEELLYAYGVETPKLASMIHAARSAGAYGAKLSGAGGGDCMIAVVSPEKREAVAKAIEKSGGQVIPVETNISGVMVK